MRPRLHIAALGGIIDSHVSIHRSPCSPLTEIRTGARCRRALRRRVHHRTRAGPAHMCGLALCKVAPPTTAVSRCWTEAHQTRFGGLGHMYSDMALTSAWLSRPELCGESPFASQHQRAPHRAWRMRGGKSPMRSPSRQCLDMLRYRRNVSAENHRWAAHTCRCARPGLQASFVRSLPRARCIRARRSSARGARSSVLPAAPIRQSSASMGSYVCELFPLVRSRLGFVIRHVYPAPLAGLALNSEI